MNKNAEKPNFFSLSRGDKLTMNIDSGDGNSTGNGYSKRQNMKMNYECKTKPASKIAKILICSQAHRLFNWMVYNVQCNIML